MPQLRLTAVSNRSKHLHRLPKLQLLSTEREMVRAESAIRLLDSLFFLDDDATVVGTLPAETRGMSDHSLDERVAVLERMMGGKTLEEHFREQGELMDRRFAEVHARFAEVHARFTAQDKRFEAIDARFTALDKRFEAMDERFDRVDHELSLIRRDVGLILAKLNAM